MISQRPESARIAFPARSLSFRPGLTDRDGSFIPYASAGSARAGAGLVSRWKADGIDARIHAQLKLAAADIKRIGPVARARDIRTAQAVEFGPAGPAVRLAAHDSCVLLLEVAG
ncbi:MAG: hypothetical protein ACLFUJ_15050 [Phycisphaerae bacterium]